MKNKRTLTLKIEKLIKIYWFPKPYFGKSSYSIRGQGKLLTLYKFGFLFAKFDFSITIIIP